MSKKIVSFDKNKSILGKYQAIIWENILLELFYNRNNKL